MSTGRTSVVISALAVAEATYYKGLKYGVETAFEWAASDFWYEIKRSADSLTFDDVIALKKAWSLAEMSDQMRPPTITATMFDAVSTTASSPNLEPKSDD